MIVKVDCKMDKTIPLKPYAIILALAVCITSGLLHIRATPKAIPMMSIEPSTFIKLGEGNPGETLKGVFFIANVGEGELQFRIDPSCGCTDLNPRTGNIPAGKRTPIHVAVRLGQRGIDKTVKLAFTTNDPVTPEVDCVLLASCPRLFSVSPESVSFGHIQKGTSSKVPLRVQKANKAGDISIRNIFAQSNHPFIRTSIRHDTTGETTVAAELLPDAPAGKIIASIDVSLMDGSKRETINIPITADVGGHLVASPATIIIPECLTEPLTRDIFIWSADGGSIPTKWSAQLPEGYELAEVAPVGHRRRFRLSVVSNIVQHAHAIEIQFPQINDSITIDVARHAGLSRNENGMTDTE